MKEFGIYVVIFGYVFVILTMILYSFKLKSINIFFPYLVSSPPFLKISEVPRQFRGLKSFLESNKALYRIYNFGMLTIALGFFLSLIGIGSEYYYALPSDGSFRNYIPLISLLFIVISIILAVIFVPKNLRIATGAALGFLSAAYAYDAWIYVKASLETIAENQKQTDGQQ